jgi:hypothetical protein
VVFRLRYTGSRFTITPAAYLAENPDKTEADFLALKELSYAIYLEQVTADCRQTQKDVTIHGLEETAACAAPSVEDEVIERPERAVAEQLRQRLAGQALDMLTAVQPRRQRRMKLSIVLNAPQPNN